MSILDKLRIELGIPAAGDTAVIKAEQGVAAIPAIPAIPEPKNSKNSRNSRVPVLLIDIDTAITSWLDHIGEMDEAIRKGCLLACRRDPELRTYLLARAQEVPPADHERVLRDLRAMPERIRAIEVMDVDEAVIRLIVAIRNVGVCELLVARDKWDPFKFLALIDAEDASGPITNGP